MHYDQTVLIQAYLQANQSNYLHEDFKTYAVGLLSALERAFGISLDFEGVQNTEARPLWMLFRATAVSYLSIKHPRSSFADDSLINRILEGLGEQGKQIEAVEDIIGAANATSRTAHLDLLNKLFGLLWRDIDQVITSEDLQKLGFDDTKEPREYDYFDYF